MTQTQANTSTDEILYLAFRAAFVSTFDRVIAEFSIKSSPPTSSFLDRLPLATGSAPQVQLDLLLQTWQKLQTDPEELSVVDQCVCYCATDELAMFGETENHQMLSRISNGPKQVRGMEPMWLTSKLRIVQITWPFAVDSAVLLRDEQFLMADLDKKTRPTLNSGSSALLDVVGKWMVTPGIVSNASGLLTQTEQEELGCFFQQHQNLMNL